MSVVTEIRKTVSEVTPMMAMVGMTDLAVEQVRKVVAETSERAVELEHRVEERVSKVQSDVERTVGEIDPDYVQKFVSKALDPKAIQSGLQQAPAAVVSQAMEVAGRLESGYESLAERGRTLLARIDRQEATQVLEDQAKTAVAKAKGLATSIQRTNQEIGDGVKQTLEIAAEDAVQTVDAVGEVLDESAAATQQAVAKTVEARTARTRKAVKRTSKTVERRTSATKVAAKSAATSAAKTAEKAGVAAQKAAEKVGD